VAAFLHLPSLREAPVLRLLLLRHAKSDWSGQADDHDRPLSARGRKAVPRIGLFMHRKDYEPALILCSTSSRTRETLDLLLPHIGAAAKIEYDRAFYLAEWPKLLGQIRAVSGDASPLLLIGHNPGIEQLAFALARQPQNEDERKRVERLAEKFPTGALAVMDFELPDWSEVKPGTGKLVDYVRPKDLHQRNDEE
jgi:phosphohistidine phosphatase